MLAPALEHLVKGIVDNPDDVQVAQKNSPRGEVLEVRVHPDDLGRVIGRGGRTAKALRTLVSALADGRKVRVERRIVPVSDDPQRRIEVLESLDLGTEADETASAVERTQLREILEEEIARLPRRQREAFLLRYWEDLNVAETALVMGCSEGSVKTHCSRAAHALAAALAARGIDR